MRLRMLPTEDIIYQIEMQLERVMVRSLPEASHEFLNTCARFRLLTIPQDMRQEYRQQGEDSARGEGCRLRGVKLNLSAFTRRFIAGINYLL